jgi:hypothetical protein
LTVIFTVWSQLKSLQAKQELDRAVSRSSAVKLPLFTEPWEQFIKQAPDELVYAEDQHELLQAFYKWQVR